MGMTASLDCTASPVRIFGLAAVVSMPSSAIAAMATGLICSAGSVPAERTSMRSRARCISSAAAIWERPALCTHTNKTLGLAAITRNSNGFGSLGEQSWAKRQRDIDKRDEDRDFDEWTHHAGQRLPGGGAVSGDRHRDRQFEVVARGSECHGGSAGIPQFQRNSKGIPASPDDREVSQQW